jgi:hypothetical protein
LKLRPGTRVCFFDDMAGELDGLAFEALKVQSIARPVVVVGGVYPSGLISRAMTLVGARWLTEAYLPRLSIWIQYDENVRRRTSPLIKYFLYYCTLLDWLT